MHANHHRRHELHDTPRVIDPEQELTSLRFTQQEAVARRNVENSSSSNELRTQQRLSLDCAVAPLLSSPITPFQKSERKKAHTSAMYYSECFLKGVTPTDADNAASDIQGRYNKWWVQEGFHDASDTSSTTKNTREQSREDSHRLGVVDTSIEESRFSKRPLHENYSSHKATPVGRKRLRRRGMIRDMIQDNTVDPHDHDTTHSAASVTLDDECFRVASRTTSPPSSEFSIRSIPNLSNVTREQIEMIRNEMVTELKANGGDTDSSTFQSKLAILNSSYLSSDNDARAIHGSVSAFDLDGTWLSLTKPTYHDAKGRNEIGQYVYSLGRMSFDMFRPTNLVCSIQGTFNTIHAIHPESEQAPAFIPRPLRKEVLRSISNHQADSLRTYNIVVAFTIEPNQTRTGQTVRRHRKPPEEFVVRRPIRGIMTNYGYMLPDPDVPNRMSIWFTGGTLEVNDEENDLEEWKRIFDDSAVPRRDMREFARLLAAKVLLGANASDTLEEDGSMNYTLKRPIGGHGFAFCDVLYLDDSLRIMRGHHGSLYVFSKVISSEDDRSD